jgi:hypothetical protein
MKFKKSTLVYIAVMGFLAFNVLLYYFIQTYFS